MFEEDFNRVADVNNKDLHLTIEYENFVDRYVHLIDLSISKFELIKLKSPILYEKLYNEFIDYHCKVNNMFQITTSDNQIVYTTPDRIQYLMSEYEEHFT